MRKSMTLFGENSFLITFENESGASVSVTNAGAALVSFIADGRDTVLGYGSASGYLASPSYQGELVGRYANRIAGARFSLNGKEYRLYENVKGASLHGGKLGFSHREWDISVISPDSVTFSLLSPDGDEGYPGELLIEVTYRFTEQNELFVTVTAEAKEDTVFNPVLHPYFNLNKNMQTSAAFHKLQVFANEFTPLSDTLVSDGTLLPVENTPYDFREPKIINECLASDHPQIKAGGGLDINFLLSKGFEFGTAVKLFSEDGEMVLEISTDRPAVQVYSSNALDEPNGKCGLLFKHQGIAIETQMLPNSVNIPSFPSTVLKKGEKYKSTTLYKLYKNISE